jgi:hypothetical protein
VRSPGFNAFLVFPGPHDIDRGGVERGLDVLCVVFLDHLHARAAVRRDLVRCRRPPSGAGMPQAVRRSRSAVAIEAETCNRQRQQREKHS